jgi:hypothetical protein
MRRQPIYSVSRHIYHLPNYRHAKFCNVIYRAYEKNKELDKHTIKVNRNSHDCYPHAFWCGFPQL